MRHLGGLGTWNCVVLCFGCGGYLSVCFVCILLMCAANVIQWRAASVNKYRPLDVWIMERAYIENIHIYIHIRFSYVVCWSYVWVWMCFVKQVANWVSRELLFCSLHGVVGRTYCSSYDASPTPTPLLWLDLLLWMFCIFVVAFSLSNGDFALWRVCLRDSPRRCQTSRETKSHIIFQKSFDFLLGSEKARFFFWSVAKRSVCANIFCIWNDFRCVNKMRYARYQWCEEMDGGGRGGLCYLCAATLGS